MGKEHQAILRLIETTDLHGHIRSFDYLREKPAPGTGLQHVAGLIEAARAEVEQSLVFDNGDTIQGTPLADLLAQDHDWADAHPVMKAMNEIGYDGAAVGNHDLNFGLDFAANSFRQLDCPIVLTNFEVLGGGEDDWFARYEILEHAVEIGATLVPLKIGLLGFIPPQVMRWDHGHLNGRVEVHDIVDSARKWTPKLKTSGADLIVALAHTGIGPKQAEPGMENAVLPLGAVAGIDVIFAGHQHLRFPNPDTEDAGKTTGKPVVMAGSRGACIGIVDLTLEHDEDGWRIADHVAELRDKFVEPSLSSQKIAESAEKPHRATIELLNRRVGQTDRPLHSFFSVLGRDRGLDLVATAQFHAAQRVLENSGQLDRPLLSAVSPFRNGGRGGPEHFTDIAAGALTMRSVADLYSFPNALAAVRINGKTLRLWLERSASVFEQIAPGQTGQQLICSDAPVFNLESIYGLEYRVDLS